MTKWDYLIEAYTDVRMAKLLIKVNAKNKGSGDDLEALFNLANRARKSIGWMDSRGDTFIGITHVLPSKPKGRNWVDTLNVYKTAEGPHAQERIFVTEDAPSEPNHWWTFEEIVRHHNFRGFVLE